MNFIQVNNMFVSNLFLLNVFYITLRVQNLSTSFKDSSSFHHTKGESG